MTNDAGLPGPAAGDPLPPAPPPAPSFPPPAQSSPPPAPSFPPPAQTYPPPAQSYPPPAAGAPTPPPAATGPGAGSTTGFDPKSLQNFDPKSVEPLDWGVIAAGVLIFIFSTFSYYKYSVKISGFGGSSGTVSAWHGFFGWFAAIVALAAAGVLAANVIAKVSLPFPVRLAVLGGFALALLCTLLALVVVPGNSGGSFGGVHIDKGHGFSYWVSLLLVLAGTAMAYVRFTQTGGKLPGRS